MAEEKEKATAKQQGTKTPSVPPEGELSEKDLQDVAGGLCSCSGTKCTGPVQER